MCDTARSLRKNEFFIKTILDSLSGTQMGSIPEKLNCKKSRDTASLSPPMPCTSKIFMFSYRLISEEGTLFGVEFELAENDRLRRRKASGIACTAIIIHS